MVRAGDDNELFDIFYDESLVAIGWEEMGDLSKLPTREEVKNRYKEAYPEHKKRRRYTNSGQLYRFAHEIEQGDIVLTYNKSTREYLIGKIISDYQPNPNPDLTEKSHYKHSREVNWDRKVSRDEFSVSAKNSFGSTLTVFQVTDHLEEIKKVPKDGDGNGNGGTGLFLEEVEAKASELISDIVSGIDPFDFQDLVAAVLRTMGYQTQVSPPGPDEGIDIIAHPDALGFKKPMIKVQVKRRKQSVGSQEMQSFIGAIGDEDKGLYVSTGGYTKHAQKAADTSRRRLTLLERDDFIDLLIQNYEDIEPEYKTLVPLKKVYIPKEE